MSRTILTLQEIADRTRVPINTLRFYRSTGQGPKTWRLAGRVVAFEDDVERWLDEQYNQPMRA